MQTKEIQTEFNVTFTEMLKLISGFDQEQFNRKPDEKKWSAGQVAGHLIKANSFALGLLNGKTAETERKPGDMVKKIKADFLNFEKKMDAPDFIVPEENDYDRENSLNTLKNLKSEINEVSQTADLTRTCLGFEFPGYGFLTGIEILSFIVFHTQRHIWQLKKLHDRLAQNSGEGREAESPG